MTAYTLLKSLLDPVVLLLVVLAIGGVAAWKRRQRSGSLVFAIAFFFLYLASIAPASDGLFYLLERDSYARVNDERGPLDVVVVLAGGATRNRSLGADTLNRQSAIRLVRAIEVFNSSGAQYLVCAGTTESFNESGIMAAAASHLGVPAARIRTDMKSRNTREHAVELSRMFPDRELRLGLVTSAYHMPRSAHEFRRFFDNVVAFPTDYQYSYTGLTAFSLLPSAARLNTLSMALSEVVGIAWYRVREKLLSDVLFRDGKRLAAA
jgi:uncharacterized SAM-binding protein YcdF (DUF218 family)